MLEVTIRSAADMLGYSAQYGDVVLQKGSAGNQSSRRAAQQLQILKEWADV